MSGGNTSDGANAGGDGLGDLASMPGGPDAAGVDTTAAAVDENTFHHHIQKLFPAIDTIVTDQNLRKTGSVNLHTRVAGVLVNGFLAAENHASSATRQDRTPHIMSAGVQGHDLRRNARCDKCRRDPVGRPRLLGSRFEHQPHLQRDHRQPQRVHAGRIGRQNGTQYRRLGLITDHDISGFHAVTARQNLRIQTACQGIQNLGHVSQHKAVLGHVAPAHVLRQAGGRRLLKNKVVG